MPGTCKFERIFRQNKAEKRRISRAKSRFDNAAFADRCRNCISGTLEIHYSITSSPDRHLGIPGSNDDIDEPSIYLAAKLKMR